MTGTLSSVYVFSMIYGCRSGTLCSGTVVGWSTGWGRSNERWRKVALLLYAFGISEPYLSEVIVFSFFVDRMASMLEAV